MKVSAPGKMVLAGEYAVLVGEPAVACAVNARASIILDKSGSTINTEASPEVVAVRNLVTERFGPLPSIPWTIDRSQLGTKDTKFGLGSSGALAAAASLLFHRLAGQGENIESIAECAFSGHHRISPNGSGIDVAASLHGGLFLFQRGPWVSPIANQLPFEFSVIFTGHAVRSAELIGHFMRWRDLQPVAAQQWASAMGQSATALSQSIGTQNFEQARDAVKQGYRLFQTLGQFLAQPLITHELQLIHHLAQKHQGEAKPSGAGGGDIAFALFDHAQKRSSFENDCRANRLTPLSLTIEPVGVKEDL